MDPDKVKEVITDLNEFSAIRLPNDNGASYLWNYDNGNFTLTVSPGSYDIAFINRCIAELEEGLTYVNPTSQPVAIAKKAGQVTPDPAKPMQLIVQEVDLDLGLLKKMMEPTQTPLSSMAPGVVEVNSSHLPLLDSLGFEKLGGSEFPKKVTDGKWRMAMVGQVDVARLMIKLPSSAGQDKVYGVIAELSVALKNAVGDPPVMVQSIYGDAQKSFVRQYKAESGKDMNIVKIDISALDPAAVELLRAEISQAIEVGTGKIAEAIASSVSGDGLPGMFSGGKTILD